MKIVVIGGSGLIGTNLVKRLRERGHEVVAASRSSGIDAVTGAGLPAAMAGANVVVDVANSPSFEDAAVLAFFEASSRNLLAAEAAAGVGHHVALSVVGADRNPRQRLHAGKGRPGAADPVRAESRSRSSVPRSSSSSWAPSPSRAPTATRFDCRPR